jgi:2-polyprenyl-3-methyl-5-hydroxy-6-metoxy-1,4-benzoquinol methylase
MGHADSPASREGDAKARGHHVCPWWLGYFLVSPLRRLAEPPERMLNAHVRPGMTVLDLGSGMGYFSLPAARLAGPEGRVLCLDVQQRMLNALERRARRAGLSDRIETRLVSNGDLGLEFSPATVDVALALHVLHEIPDLGSTFRQLLVALRPGATILVVEPRGHVKERDFLVTLGQAEQVGFAMERQPGPRRSLAALLRAPGKAPT